MNYFNSDYLKYNLKPQAIKGAGLIVFSRVAVYGTQVLGTMILARILFPSDFGLVAMVFVFSNILIEFGTLRLGDATVQRAVISHKVISTLFWINLVLCTFISLLMMSISPLISLLYNEPRLKLITVIISIGFIFSGLSVQHMALLQRNMEFFKITIISVVSALLSDIIAITLAVFGIGYWALIARRLGLPIITAIGVWICCKWRPGLPKFVEGVTPMLKFGLNSLGNYTMQYFVRSFDKLLVGWKYGPISLGFYERAYYLFVLPTNQLTYPLTSVAVATLSRLQSQPDKFVRYYLEAISTLAFIGMPISAFITLIGKDLILILLGEKWQEAGNIISLLGPGIGIMIIYATNGWLHLSLGRPDRWFRWGVIASIVTLLFFLFGLSFGVSGVAVCYVLSFYFLTLPGLHYAGKPINLSVISIIKKIWKFFLSALTAGIFSWWFLYSFGGFCVIFSSFSPLLRIIITFFFFSIFYSIFIIASYQSFLPFSSLLSIITDINKIKK